MKKSKPVEGWCIKNKYGLQASSVRRTKTDVWDAWVWPIHTPKLKRMEIRVWRRRGLRVVRVTITED